MLEIKSKLKILRSAYKVEVRGQLRLPFASRQNSRLKTKLLSGEEVSLMLPRDEFLRGGDLVTASDGRIIEVIAEPEKVAHVTCSSVVELAKAAYHLGSRHVPVQVGEGFLRLAADHVLEEMLVKLGATVAHLEAPFEPEAGAHGDDHRHDEVGHGHVHDEHCGHDHSHDHAHCDHPHQHHKK